MSVLIQQAVGWLLGVLSLCLKGSIVRLLHPPTTPSSTRRAGPPLLETLLRIWATFCFISMSSIRVKKVREPLVYVPVQQGQVSVVPTEMIPSPEELDSPVNHEYLVEHARRLSGTSVASARFVPRSQRADSIPPNTTRRRSKTLGALESGASSDLTNTRPISSTSNFQRPFRNRSGSWFEHHVANSSIDASSGRPVLQANPSQASSIPLTQERASTAPGATLEAVIPEEVGAGLAGTLQDRKLSSTSLESGIHSDDIVDHLSIIGTPNTHRSTWYLNRDRCAYCDGFTPE